jgi:hypothetical protein
MRHSQSAKRHGGTWGGTINPAETEVFAEELAALAVACWLAGGGHARAQSDFDGDGWQLDPGVFRL